MKKLSLFTLLLLVLLCLCSTAFAASIYGQQSISYITDANGYVSNLTDDEASTAWTKAGEDTVDLSLHFNSSTVGEIWVRNGYAYTQNWYNHYDRPASLKVTVHYYANRYTTSYDTYRYSLTDAYRPNTMSKSWNSGYQRLLLPKKYTGVTLIELTIENAYAGYGRTGATISDIIVASGSHATATPKSYATATPKPYVVYITATPGPAYEEENDNPWVEYITPVPEDEEDDDNPLVEYITPRPTREPVVEVITPRPTREPVIEVITPRPTREPVVEVITPRPTREPVVEIITPRPTREPVVEVITPRPTREPVVEVITPRPTAEPVVMPVVPPTVTEEPLVELITPVPTASIEYPSDDPVIGYATQRLATRSGPSTGFAEPGSFFSEGQEVNVVTKVWDENNEFYWYQIEFKYRKEWYRAYTTASRIDVNPELVPDEPQFGQALDICNMQEEHVAYYGPGTEYKKLTKLSKGRECPVYIVENGWAQVEFINFANGEKYRGWVPLYALYGE